MNFCVGTEGVFNTLLNFFFKNTNRVNNVAKL